MLSRLPIVVLTVLSCAPLIGAQSKAGAPPPPPAYDVTDQSIERLQDALQAGRVTSRQLVEVYLARIEAYDRQGPALNAITVLNPRARETADALDAERKAKGPRGPLHGIPVLVKDNYETIEMPTSAGSIALAGFHPPRDAFQVRKLKDAGAIILGKTNMHELAAGITTVGSRFGYTRNPYGLDRNPGGSSGGTGAAIAASFAAVGMGSDTCGSIRIPASHNNLVGLRGTQGLASRTGIVPLSSTQDIGGPIARTMIDLAIVLDATVGPDPADPSTAVSAGRTPSYRAMLGSATLSGARLGVVSGLFGSVPDDQEVTTVIDRALDVLKKAGAEVSDVVIPGLDDLLRDSSLINADFKFDLADYLAGAPGAPVRSLGEILDRGLYHTALEANFRARNLVESRDTEQSRRARIKRVALRQAIESVLAEHRLAALIYPTIRRKPARIGEAQAGSQCQVSAHSGLPALGLPAGFTEDELPIGMELMGAAFSEPQLMALGYAVEQTLALRRVPFSTPALVDGRRPPPVSTTVPFGRRAASGGRPAPRGDVVRISVDLTSSRLEFSVDGGADVAAIWLHAGTSAKPGAARHRLWAAGLARSGALVLSAADRQDLQAGRLLMRIYRDGAASPEDLPISLKPEPTQSSAAPRELGIRRSM
jgi:Asp-tRNA(Asn)/Glu-tRNA(Gln) amidotransferase A subunit family amidase